MLPPGTTIHTILRHVSKSGMVRDISVILLSNLWPGESRDITHDVAIALRLKRQRNGGVRVHGVGMDMGFNLIYQLGALLYPNGFTLAKGQQGRNGDTSRHDPDGGYALNQRWL